MLSAMDSGLYVGTLRHRRFRPASHEFTYPVFMAMLDIDRLPELMKVSPFTSYNRWNWASFCERDHFGDPRLPLRERLRTDAAARGLTLPGGRIFLLTHLRYLGYCFNPVSFYYCYGAGGAPEMVLAEVNNTFGETFNYWLHAGNERPSARAKRYETGKVFHVSPFMGLGLTYTWIFTPPGERLVAHMNTLEDGQIFFDATLALERRPWEARCLHGTLARFPWMTAKVVAAIHWEALRLWGKGVPLVPRPGAASSGKPRRSRLKYV